MTDRPERCPECDGTVDQHATWCETLHRGKDATEDALTKLCLATFTFTDTDGYLSTSVRSNRNAARRVLEWLRSPEGIAALAADKAIFSAMWCEVARALGNTTTVPDEFFDKLTEEKPWARRDPGTGKRP